MAHLGNLTHQPLDATLFQVYYASAIGIFFAAIYLRTGSLWWTIILHFLVDFTSVLMSQSTQAAPATSIWHFILWLPLIAIGLFLIRPKKLMPLDVLVTDTLYSISKLDKKLTFGVLFLSKSLLPTLSILTLPIRLGFIKISYQVFIDSYQDFDDIRLLILL
ncbi:MAG: type II CAAX prenyl endopeptidase Rce1 family protein [Streptococcus sp.]